MARKSTYETQFRRRKEGKTDYRKRLALLKSGTPRIVVRRTNKHVICQAVRYKPEGDATVVHVNSQQLAKFGWKHGQKSLPAAYLTGLLAGTKAKAKGVEKAVLDIGLAMPKHQGWWCSCLKGVMDAGVEVKADKEIFPKDERVAGKHIEAFLKKPVSKEFEEAKKKIMESK